MKTAICNTSEAPRKSKARNITFYLDEIRERFGLEFDKLEAICTDGSIRPPYPYQWRATTKIRVGDDDAFEGLAESPLKAIYELWRNVKNIIEHPLEDEETTPL